VRSFTLPNGLVVYLVERPALPLVAVRLVFRVGSYEDPSERPGLARITAELLTEGVKGQTAMQLAERVGRIGATLGSGADEDGSAVTLAALRPHLPEALQIVSAVARTPAFPDAEITRVKRQTLDLLARVHQEPDEMAALVLRGALLGPAHPYGRHEAGTPAALAAITREEIVRFHARHYTPRNAALVLVGQITEAEARRLVTPVFRSWTGEVVAAAPEQAARPAAGRLLLVDRAGAEQSQLVVGQVGPARGSPDMVPLLVMNTILGGSFGSRINLNLRERHGYTYGASSGFAFARRPGPFVVSTAVKTSVTAAALKEILAELALMARGTVTDAELTDARQFLSTAVSGWFVTNEAVAGAVSRLFLNELPVDFWTTFPGKVRAVTAADVAWVARTHLQPGVMKVVVVGDAKALGESLEPLGLGAPTKVQP
jgi:zinc protease